MCGAGKSYDRLGSRARIRRQIQGEVRTLTGCLTKTGGNECLLTAIDGSTREIHGSDGVDLGDKVNHTVEAKGVVSHAKDHNLKKDELDMAHDTGVTKNNAEHGHLKVTDVRSVGDSCQQ